MSLIISRKELEIGSLGMSGLLVLMFLVLVLSVTACSEREDPQDSVVPENSSVEQAVAKLGVSLIPKIGLWPAVTCSPDPAR